MLGMLSREDIWERIEALNKLLGKLNTAEPCPNRRYGEIGSPKHGNAHGYGALLICGDCGDVRCGSCPGSRCQCQNDE